VQHAFWSQDPGKLAVVAASLCCILPIVFAIAVVGIVGASAFFADPPIIAIVRLAEK
jgi:hypothetical protein